VQSRIWLPYDLRCRERYDLIRPDKVVTIHPEDVFSTSIPMVIIFTGESSLPSSFRMVEVAILALMTTFQVVGWNHPIN
jgi:hypothetical protein